jgi:hypothetical protein
VTFTANKVGFDTANAADSVENNAVGPEDDVINATVAQLVGATVDGKGGADVLNITGTAAPNEIADLQSITFTGVETVNLAATVEGVKMDAADLGNGPGQTSKINGASGTLQSLEVNTGTNLSNVAISNIETLIMTGNVTMKVAQHNAFTQINAPGGADQITLSDGGTLTADADVETYVLANAVGNNISLTAAGQNVTGGTKDDTVQTNGLATLTGTINLGGQTNADTLKVTGASVDISGATLSNIETLDVGNNLNVTLTAAQLAAFTTFFGLGTNTVTVTTQATGVNALVVDQTVSNSRSVFETFVLQSNANDTATFKLANLGATSHTIDITAGGADTITLNNVSIDNGTGVVTVVGFSFLDDKIGSQVNGTSIVTGAYVNADAGNKITGQASGNVIEIHSLGANGVQVAAPTNPLSLLAALNQVLANGGSAADIADGDYTVIAYNGNNGYVYQVNIAGANGTGGGDDTVELIGILQNVGADTLTAANFV